MKSPRRHFVLSLCAGACALLLGAAGDISAQTRDPVNPLNPDPLKAPIWPFASTSPWNMPIGSGAQYVPINLAVPFGHGTPPDTSNWAPVPGISDEYIVLTPTAPLTDIVFNQVGWNQGDRCATDNPGGVLVQVPIPTDYVVNSTLQDRSNNSAAFLMPDSRTLIQSQPFVLCRPSQTQATSVIVFNYVDVYGDGRWGSHGGSQLSAIGGSIHLGGLRPGKPVRHALAITVGSPDVLAP